MNDNIFFFFGKLNNVLFRIILHIPLLGSTRDGTQGLYTGLHSQPFSTFNFERGLVKCPDCTGKSPTCIPQPFGMLELHAHATTANPHFLYLLICWWETQVNSIPWLL